MKTVTIRKNDAGQRLDKFLQKAYPALPVSAMYKYIRKKRIKCNGKRVESSTRLCEGDELSLYLSDDLLARPTSAQGWQTLTPHLTVCYEDAAVLIAAKPFGQSAHPDADQAEGTLIDHIKAYLYQKGEYRPEEEQSFAPALCNRIDRNTAGLVIAAKTAEALRGINRQIRDRAVTKKYLCITEGIPNPARATLSGHLTKDTARNRVFVSAEPTEGSKKIVTRYSVSETAGHFALVRIELLTGRSHQIRAHMASIGCPLLGDRKYGASPRADHRYQALCAYELRFPSLTEEGVFHTVTLPNAEELLGWSKLP